MKHQQKPRDREFNIIAAATGFGKSYYIADLIDHSRDKNAIIYKEPINMHDPSHAHYPLVNYKDYRGGKVKMSRADVPIDVFLKGVYEHFRNGIIVLDDARLYAKYMLTDEMIDIITMKRHMDVDIFFLYQGLGVIPVQCYDYANNLILGGEIKSMVKERKLDVPDSVLAARERIKKQIAAGNKYYKEVIKLA